MSDIGPERDALPPEGEPWASLYETHTGVVVLLGGLALKFKKPVDLGFVDYTHLDQRRDACAREVALNGRLSADVYRGAATLVDDHGEVVDHVVVMKRLPANSKLSVLARAGVDVDDVLRAVARRVAAFHATGAPAALPVTGVTVGELWRSAVTVVRAHRDTVDPTVCDDVERLALRYLEGRGPLLESRAREGCVVEGHGDLMAEDIFCLPDGPRILDCLEFDDRLRTLDRIDDSAFLAMDLERLGQPHLGSRFLGWYREFIDDPAPASLLDHYLAYRAFVRAKVACLRLDQGGPGARSEARRCAAMTLSHLEQASVTLVLVGGAPGTGKSTLADGLADRLGLACLHSDRVRKELAGVAPMTAHPSGFEQGLYDADRTTETYQEMLARARLLLGNGESVVLDATWARADLRDLAARAAADCAADLVELRCDLPEPVAETRILDRDATSDDGSSRSDADVAVARALRRESAEWPTAHLVDTAAPAEDCLGRAVAFVRPPDDRAVRPHWPTLSPD
jgi:uncharacterized protein